MLTPLDLDFQEGDPYRSEYHNEIVSGSMRVARAWPKEHDAEGRHAGVRFEKGMAAFHFSKADPSFVSGVLAGVASIDYVGGGYRLVVSEPFRSPDDWGIIVMWDGKPLPEMIQGGKTETETYFMEPRASGEVVISVVGRR